MFCGTGTVVQWRGAAEGVWLDSKIIHSFAANSTITCLKGDPLTVVEDSAESGERQALDFLGGVEKKAA